MRARCSYVFIADDVRDAVGNEPSELPGVGSQSAGLFKAGKCRDPLDPGPCARGHAAVDGRTDQTGTHCALALARAAVPREQIGDRLAAYQLAHPSVADC